MPYFGPYFGLGTATLVPDGPDAAPDALAVQYCTDEDIAAVALEDFTAIVPRSARIAEGTDGVFDADDRWTLSSATNDFDALGCLPNQVVALGPLPKANFGKVAGGELLAVNAVASGGVQLRRVGLALGRGAPPSPAGGLTGVHFSIQTFASLIDQASREANQAYGIDPDATGRTPDDLKPSSLIDLKYWTVLTVLQAAYVQASKTNDSDFKLKLALNEKKLNQVSARLSVLWGPSGDSAPPSGRFGGRAVR